MVKNAYPELPEFPYVKTSVEMGEVIAYLKAVPETLAVKRAAYTYFRIESANGKSGVNNNYSGVQADGNRWPAQFDDYILGTCVTPENKTLKLRRFVVFASPYKSIDFTIANIKRRGMYIGGKTHFISKMDVKNVTDLVTAYKREWVKGSASYVPTAEEIAPFASIYKQAETIFK